MKDFSLEEYLEDLRQLEEGQESLLRSKLRHIVPTYAPSQEAVHS